MKKTKIIAIVSVGLCVVLASSLVGVVLHYQKLERQKEQEKRDLFFRLLNEAYVAYQYWANWTRWQGLEPNATEEWRFIKQHKELYDFILNDYDPRTLDTVIVHACVKTAENYTLPNVADFFKKNREGVAPYEVLVIPEINGNLNFTEFIDYISTNYTGIDICLNVFEGGDNSPIPNVKLTIQQIEQIMAVADVKMVRFAELISFYLERIRNYPEVDFPYDWIRDILEFCTSKELGVLWSEWKISDDVLPYLNEAIYGYEDIVTVTYQTNNQYNFPFIGFLYATQFEHYGASVQSWYKDEAGEHQYDLPLNKVLEYAKLARNMGAEIIQIEPYWYFFKDGEPKETILKLWSVI